MLCQLNLKYDVDMPAVRRMITRIEADEGLSLDECRKCRGGSIRNGVLIITGGRVRKDNDNHAIIKYFEYEGLEIRLAAPTGRAAKRMSEATGYEAQTIHRMLELSGAPSDSTAARFERNENNRWRLMRSLLMRCLWLTLIC